MIVEAELHVPIATAQLVRFTTAEPSEGVMVEDVHRLDLCLTPRPAEASLTYCDRWRPSRFEQIGDLFLLPAGETVLARGGVGQSASIVHKLHPEPLQHWLEDEDLEWTDERLESCLNLQNSNLRGHLLRLADEVRRPGFASAVMAELITAQVAIELARHVRVMDEDKPSGGLAPWRLRLIEERLADANAPPTLSELARLCGLSSRQLARAFRASHGCSVGDYVAEKRIEKAKRMLLRDDSVKRVAYDLGFRSPSSFCFAFRRATGETPGQYQRRERSG